MFDKKIRVLLILFIAMFFSNFAFANEMLQPLGDNDLVAQHQQLITGADINNPFSSHVENTILSVSSKLFTGMLLSLAVAVSVYGIVMGTLMTAHDGVVLGKRWNSPIILLKMCFGFLLIAPIPTYSVGQLAFLQLNAWGLQSALYIEKKIIDILPFNTTYNNQLSNKESIQPILNAQIRLNVCNLMSQQDFIKAKQQGDQSYLAKVFSYTTSSSNPNFTSVMSGSSNNGKTNYNWIYGDQSSMFNKNACGTLNFEGINSTDDNINSNDFVLAESMKPKLNDIKSQFNSLHVQQISNMNNSALVMAQKIVNHQYTSPDEFTTDYKSALDTYSDSLNDLAKNLYASYVNNDSLSGFTEQGIFSLGAIFNTFAVVQGSIEEYKDKRAITSLTYNGDSDSANNAVLGANNYIQYASNKVNPLVSPRQTTVESQGDGVVDKIVSTVIDNMPNLAPFMSAQKNNINPISNSINMGLTIQHSYVVASGVALGTSVAAKAASGVPFIGGLGTATAFIAEKALSILNLILVPSVLMANVIPLLPVMIWFWFLLGSYMFIVKGLIAVQMWGFTYMVPDNDDFVGKQGQGYINLTIAFTQYPLGVIGFFTGLACLIVGALTLNGLFGLIALNKMGGLTGLVNYIVILCVYAITYTIMIKECLSLCYLLPDHLFSWLGNSTNHLQRHDGQESNIIGAGAGIGSLTSAITSRSPNFGRTPDNNDNNGKSTDKPDFAKKNRSDFKIKFRINSGK